MANDQPDTLNTTRRHVLRAIGVGAALTSGAGTAVAEGNIGNLDGSNDEAETPPKGQVKNTCPEGTTLLAKYNVDENGAFVFEKGRDGLDIDGSEITFSNVETKPSEPGEVLAFDWDSSVYDVSSIGVKFGTSVERWDVGDETTGTIDVRDRSEGEMPVKAISNVIFCIEVHWQVDFGLGPLLTPPAYKDNGRASDLLMAAFGQYPEDGQYEQNPSIDRLDGKPITVLGDPDQFDVSGGTATVRFAVTGSESLTVHLASFETPGPFEYDEVPSQVRFDSTEVVVDPGFNELEVDLPPL
jgi:hypothetical protein